jgi:hypothetical protein
VSFGFLKQNRHLQFSETSDVSMDDILHMLKASHVGMQSLKRLAMLAAVEELVGPV